MGGLEAHAFQQLGDAPLDVLRPRQQPVRDDGLGNAEAHGLARVQRGKGVLEDVLDVLAQLHAAGSVELGDVLSGKADGAAGGRNELLQRLADGRLAAARLAHQRQRFAWVDLETDFFHRVHAVGDLAEPVVRNVKAGAEFFNREQWRAGVYGVLHLFDADLAQFIAIQHREWHALGQRLAAQGAESWHGREQGAGVGMLRGVEDLRHRPVFDLAAAPHHHHVIGHLRDHAHVVGDEDHSRVQIALQLTDDVEDLRLDGHVQCCRGFVGNQQRRLAGQRHGDHGALAHAARERMRVAVEQALGVGQAYFFQQGSGLFACIRHAQALVQDQRFGYLVANREHRVQRCHGLLEDHGDLVATDGAQGVVAGRAQVLDAAAWRVEQDLAVHNLSARIVGEPHDGL